MRTNQPGMRRYLYEQLYVNAVEVTKARTQAPFMISEAKRLRLELESNLAAAGTSMDDPNLGISQVLGAIDDTLGASVADYQPVYPQRSARDEQYQRAYGVFSDRMAIGSSATPGAMGRRLPISPYDPRFANRSTVKRAGSAVLTVPEQVIDTELDGSIARLPEAGGEGVVLYTEDAENNRLVEAGRAQTLDDVSGMSELMGRMSAREYDDVRGWVIDGARDESGRIDVSRFMSTDALARSAAILDHLADRGLSYRVSKDRQPGQIKATIDGTAVSVRLSDTRADENYVGRVYGDGISTYFSTNVHQRDSNYTVRYNPTVQDCVDLVDYALGGTFPTGEGQPRAGSNETYEVMQYDRKLGQAVPMPHNVAFHQNGKFTTAIKDYVGPDGARTPGGKVQIKRDGAKRTAAAKFFANGAVAESYLRTAVDTARENFAEALHVDELVEAAQRVADGDTEVLPQFSGDTAVAAIQRSYWDVLTGAQEVLLAPGVEAEQYEQRVGAIGGTGLGDTVADLEIYGSPQTKVRDHATALVETYIGTYDFNVADPSGVPARFDPVHVSQFMDSDASVYRNNDDIVAALRRVPEIDPQQLRGSDFYNTTVKDRLVSFDPSTARTPDPETFLGRMGDEITSTLGDNGVFNVELSVDDNGIFSWSGVRNTKQSGLSTPESITGQVGQVFEPGAYGEVTTEFAGGDNYMFVPGYEASIVRQAPGENKSVEERTVLRGYEQIMREQIRYNLSTDLLTTRDQVGEPTNLNSTYRRLYDVRHEVDFIQRSREEGLSDSWREAILATEARRVRYGNDIRDGSTINAEYQAAQGRGVSDPSNDNFFDPWVKTGARNMSIMTGEGNGYFDPVLTSGSTNQGITRYLVESASVDEGGRIVRGGLDDRTPAAKHPDVANLVHDPFDRQQMTFSNLLQAASVTEPVGTAMATIGGWTADDPMVVSQRFAEAHAIRGADGQMRSLMIGDKLSDLHGNKGVISLVVDPERDLDPGQPTGDKNVDAYRQSLAKAAQMFVDNSELDVVMSPFSAVSRFNGGSAREMMQDSRDLALEQGTARDGLGHMRFIVTHMSVDKKTRTYDDDDLASGKGRRASSQLAWALGAQGCDAVMAEFYGTNSASAANFREYLITMGLDMGADGTLRVGYESQTDGEERRVFELPDIERTTKGGVNSRAMRTKFAEVLADTGGDMEIPFPLMMPSERMTPQASETTWKLPVLSSHLRTGQELSDGRSTVHDYTNQYMMVFESAFRYQDAQQRLAEDSLSETERRKYETVLVESPRKAQRAYDRITDQLKDRVFSGKHNIYKEQLMSNRLPNSATAVWTSNPTLDIDQVAISPTMAESMNISEGESVMVWRDPILRDSGVRAMRAHIEYEMELTGVAINPVMDACFDGDFDGDAVAIVKLNSSAARAEAGQKLSVAANLLDTGSKSEDGLYKLNMQNSLDVKVSQHNHPELVERFEELTLAANDVQADFEAGEITDEQRLAANTELLAPISDYYREAMGVQFGEATLSFTDTAEHLRSVMHACVETGAKGSEKKVMDYSRYLGADPHTFADLGAPQVTREDHEAVQYATAIKSFGTGVAGAYSQRGVKALRNQTLKEVLELTYPVTQSVLQAKHDPEEARIKYENLMGPARALWRGQLLESGSSPDGHTVWNAVYDKDGNPQQADPATWKEQFVALYTSADGLNVSVNEDYVAAVTNSLTDKNTGRMMNMDDPKYDAASTMDRLAYGGTYDDLITAAHERQNIFDGEKNGHFAPFAVRKNQKELARYDEVLGYAQQSPVAEPELVPVTKRDTVVAGARRGAARRSPMAATVKRVERSADPAERAHRDARADERASAVAAAEKVPAPAQRQQQPGVAYFGAEPSTDGPVAAQPAQQRQAQGQSAQEQSGVASFGSASGAQTSNFTPVSQIKPVSKGAPVQSRPRFKPVSKNALNRSNFEPEF